MFTIQGFFKHSKETLKEPDRTFCYKCGRLYKTRKFDAEIDPQ